VPGLDLTRDEAAQRSAVVTAESYEVDLDLRAARDHDRDTFPTTTRVRFRARPGASTWLDFHGPRVLAVTSNGTALDPGSALVDHRILLSGLQADNEVVVVAEGAYTRTGEGLHRTLDPTDGETYLYSQFQLADARRVLACFEQPDQKATFRFSVTAPQDWVVLSCMPAPPPQPVGDEAARWQFRATPRLSTYVAAIAAGPYHGVHAEHAGRAATIPLGVYGRRSTADHLDAADVLEVTRQGLDFFEDAFGHPFPFPKYDQLFVPEYNEGAMENAGLVTFSESTYLFRSRVTDAALEGRAEAVLHELAHMWFGDLVTMRWWDDLWLNESFATWASILAQAEATRWPDAWATFAGGLKLWALRQDQLPTTHPIVAPARTLQEVQQDFDGITYAKGAAVLRQLVSWVGRPQFLGGLTDYFRDHAWGSAELADLLRVLERHSGRDLSVWQDQWLAAAGAGTLRPVVTESPGGSVAEVRVVQQAPPEHPTLRAHRIDIGSYSRVDGVLTRRDLLVADIEGASTDVPGLRGRPRPDVVLLNDEDLTFAKVRFDDGSLAEILRGGLPRRPLTRAVIWTALTDMVRCAELPARRYVALVQAEIGAETSHTLVRTLLGFTRTAALVYADPAGSESLVTGWADTLLSLARAAPPGSDHQLAFTIAWISVASTASHAELLAELLVGRQPSVLPGLQIDADLRWRVVQRLAALGLAGDDVVDAELAADRTTAGEVAAAAARAAVPTIAAKERAWELATAAPGITNAVRRGTVDAFHQPHQGVLSRRFRDRYFAALDVIWEGQSAATAEDLVTGLFPRLLAEPATLAAADAWLAADHAPALRRLVAEGRADVGRALRAQACDAAAGGE
jgi:aminopeptidase N